MSWSRKQFITLLGLAGFWSILNRNFDVSPGDTPVIKPKRLHPGDTIGLISPASILPEAQSYETIIQTIRDLGFEVKVGPHARDRYGDLAGRDANRAADLNRMFADPEVKAIMPFRGGWGSNRILNLIDFDLIRKNPKALIGFSDITSLLLAIYAKTGLVTFHGPVGKSEWTEFTTSHFKRVLMSDGAVLMSNPEDADVTAKTLTPGRASGRLLGGNLSVLTSMLGSGYLPEWEGSILFVEDIGEDVYRVDRMLTQLKLNGILSKINGFVFGRCTDCHPANTYSLDLEQILQDHIQTLEIPSFYGSMIGHIDRMFTLPIGIRAEINADTGSIKLLEGSTSNSHH